MTFEDRALRLVAREGIYRALAVETYIKLNVILEDGKHVIVVVDGNDLFDD